MLYLASDSKQTQQQFMDSMTLRTLEAGMTAYVEALCRFLPTSKRHMVQAAALKADLQRKQLIGAAIKVLNV